MERVHIDFAGPKDGMMYLVIVDAYTKWPEIIPMKSTSTDRIIRNLYLLFCRIGFPEQIVSDNASYFVSYDFDEFLKSHSIIHKLSAQYHAATNGLAERFVQTFKSALTKMQFDDGELQQKIARFLLAYRNAPHALTKIPPTQLFMGRYLRTNIDCIQPTNNTVVAERMNDIRNKRGGRKAKPFSVGQEVAVRNYSLVNKRKWLRGTISAV